MLHHTKDILVENMDTGDLPALAFGALEQLQWRVTYANDERIIAYTPRKWNRWEHQVIITILDNEVSVTSTSVHGERKDKWNEKFTEAFSQAFELAKSRAGVREITEWRRKMIATNDATEAEERETALVLNPGKQKPLIAIVIIAINCLMYIIMVASGLDFMSPSPGEMLQWGGNYGPSTIHGEPWRLFTSIFLHYGVLHLLFNSIALYMVSATLEPMLGRARFLAAYLCTGVLASVASLWWHLPGGAVSAGASGAVFGLFGVMLALLSTKLIPAAARASLFQSLGLFVVYNLAYGLKSPGTDNAAHVGGLVAGLLLGYIFYAQLRRELNAARETGVIKRANPAGLLGLVAATALIVWATQTQPVFKNAVASQTKYSTILAEFSALEGTSIGIYQNTDGRDDEQYQTALKDTVLVNWTKSIALMEEAAALKLDEREQQVVQLLKDYSVLRAEETNIIIQYLASPGKETPTELEDVRKQIEAKLAELEGLAQ